MSCWRGSCSPSHMLLDAAHTCTLRFPAADRLALHSPSCCRPFFAPAEPSRRDLPTSRCTGRAWTRFGGADNLRLEVDMTSWGRGAVMSQQSPATTSTAGRMWAIAVWALYLASYL